MKVSAPMRGAGRVSGTIPALKRWATVRNTVALGQARRSSADRNVRPTRRFIRSWNPNPAHSENSLRSRLEPHAGTGSFDFVVRAASAVGHFTQDDNVD